MINLGEVRPGSTIYIPFNTFDSNDPSASVTITGLATTDIEIYKDGSVTQRASDTGYTLLDTDGIDFDGTTGIHGISVDLSSNATAGFYAAGSKYFVVIASITVDAATVNFIPVTFTIGYPNALINTTIATLSTQTSFTLTDGPAEADALNGMWAIVHDVASQVQLGHVLISDYAATTKTVTLAAGATFTVAATDNISIMGLAPLQGTTIGNTLDVSATGEAGIDWANVGSPSTSVNLSGTTTNLVNTTTTNTDMVGTDGAATSAKQDTMETTLNAAATAASISALNDVAATDIVSAGAINTSSGAVSTVTLTNTVTTYTGNTPQTGDNFARIGAAGAGLTNINLPNQTMDITGNITGNVSGTVGSVTGAVGSVTAQVSADVTAISGDSGAADKMEEGATALQLGAAVTGTLSTTEMTTDLTEATNDHFNGRIITWTSGVLAQQSTDITDYAGTNGHLTFTAVTEAPGNGDTFVIS